MMPHRIATQNELFIAIITFFSTLLTGEVILDFIVGIVTYTTARLFYYYNGDRIKRLYEKIKTLFKK